MVARSGAAAKRVGASLVLGVRALALLLRDQFLTRSSADEHKDVTSLPKYRFATNGLSTNLGTETTLDAPLTSVQRKEQHPLEDAHSRGRACVIPGFADVRGRHAILQGSPRLVFGPGFWIEGRTSSGVIFPSHWRADVAGLPSWLAVRQA